MDYYENKLTQSVEEPKRMSDKKILCYCGFFMAVTTIVVLAVQSVVLLVVNGFFPDMAEEGWFNVALTVISVLGSGLPIFLVLMKRIPKSEIGEKSRLSIGQFLGYFIVCAGAAYITNIIGMYISSFIEIIKGFKLENPLETFIFNSDMILVIIYASIIAPIVEELIFRKILLDKLRRFGDLPAILITGFAFGLFHLNLSQFFYATVLGMIFAYITIRTNRIIYAILLHMMLNFVGTGIVPYIVVNESILGTILVTIWSFGSMTIASLLIILKGRKIVLNKPNKPLVNRWYYIFNPGALLFVIICIGIIVFQVIYS